MMIIQHLQDRRIIIGLKPLQVVPEQIQVISALMIQDGVNYPRQQMFQHLMELIQIKLGLPGIV